MSEHGFEQSESAHGFKIPLYEAGDDGASSRPRGRPGEIQREHILQEDSSGSELTIHGKLVNVVHGKYTPNGPPATLAIMQFEFVGSEPHRKRFRKASIVINFVDNINKFSSDDDPEVVAIAPYGGFAMCSSTEEERSRTKISISGKFLTGTLGTSIGLETDSGWERRKSVVREDRITVYGSIRIEGRNLGPPNTAKWAISENKIQRHGIPAVLRTAVLVLPRASSGKFQAIFDIEASVDILYNVQSRLKKFLGRSVVEPVHFSQDRKPMGPDLVDLDPENLSAYAAKMKELGLIKVRIHLHTYIAIAIAV